MISYAFKRILMMIPVIICVAILVFAFMAITPGNPTYSMLSTEATDADRAELLENLGLKDPFLTQLGRYLFQLFIKGDLGVSYMTGVPVAKEVISNLPRTFVFAVSAMIIQVIVGTPLGVTAAVHQNGWGDRICMTVALLGVSIPAFWLAIQLIILFSLNLGLLPTSGIGSVKHWILPIFCNAFSGIAMQARQTRSGMLECIRSDYVVTARAKGLSENNIRYRYALPNAVIPLIQTLGDSFGMALGGTVIIENVFSIPGIGVYLTTGITQRDYPVVRGCVVVLAILFCLIMLMVDLSFAFFDPRIKAQYQNRNKRFNLKKGSSANA